MVDDSRKPTVIVKWDPMKDVNNADSHTESQQVLLPSKWNKDVAGAWRMDVYVDIMEEGDDCTVPDNLADGEETDYGTDSSSDNMSFSSSDSETDGE